MASRMLEHIATLTAAGRDDFRSANHYAWGWQDREGEADSSKAFKFGECWAAYRELYRRERITHMCPMRDAWRQFDRDECIRLDTMHGEWIIVADILGAKALPVPNVREY
jgi:hypothetical protein